MKKKFQKRSLLIRILKKIKNPSSGLLILASILILTFQWQAIASRICLNIAQLARIQGREMTDLYLKAYQFAPSDLHIRWQTAEALSRVKQYQEAVAILQSTQVENIGLYSSLIRASLIKNLVTLGKVHEAWRYFSTTAQPIPLDSRAASYLWLSILDGVISETDVTEEDFKQLVTVTLGHFLMPHELDSILIKIKQPNFWKTSEGRHLRSLLEYKAQRCCENSNNVNFKKGNTQIDIDFIAKSLNLPKEEIKVGKEYLANTEFDVVSYSSASPVLWLVNSNRIGFFNADKGKFRIDAVILNKDERYSINFYRWFFEFGRSEKPYIVSVRYCTLQPPGYSKEPEVVLSVGKPYLLQSTNGKWFNAYIIRWNPNELGIKRNVLPSIHLASRGTLWLDRFSIRDIHLDSDVDSRQQSEEVFFDPTDQSCYK